MYVDKVKAIFGGLLAVWFFGGPAYEPTSAALRTASQAIQQFFITIMNTF